MNEPLLKHRCSIAIAALADIRSGLRAEHKAFAMEGHEEVDVESFFIAMGHIVRAAYEAMDRGEYVSSGLELLAWGFCAHIISARDVFVGFRKATSDIMGPLWIDTAEAHPVMGSWTIESPFSVTVLDDVVYGVRNRLTNPDGGSMFIPEVQQQSAPEDVEGVSIDDDGIELRLDSARAPVTRYARSSPMFGDTFEQVVWPAYKRVARVGSSRAGARILCEGLTTAQWSLLLQNINEWEAHWTQQLMDTGKRYIPSFRTWITRGDYAQSPRDVHKNFYSSPKAGGKSRRPTPAVERLDFDNIFNEE